jgi:hypothetical protein
MVAESISKHVWRLRGVYGDYQPLGSYLRVLSTPSFVHFFDSALVNLDVNFPAHPLLFLSMYICLGNW